MVTDDKLILRIALASTKPIYPSTSMSSDPTTSSLNQLLAKVQASSSLLPTEVLCLISSFRSKHSTASVHSTAYLILSSLCQSLRSKAKGGDHDAATMDIVRIFQDSVVNFVGDTEEQAIITGLSFLSALFQVDWESASMILLQEGVIDNIMDNVDLSPSADLAYETAHLIGQACGHKKCRTHLTPRVNLWLESEVTNTQNQRVAAAATVALVKLQKGASADDPVNEAPDKSDALAQNLKSIIMTNGELSSMVEAIEGMAYLTIDPAIKETLSRDPAFLKRIFSLFSYRKLNSPVTSGNLSLVYGVLSIITNITSYRPRLSEEQSQVEKLKSMTKSGKGSLSAQEPSILDSDDHVRARVRRLIDAGVLPVFSAAMSQTNSRGVRLNVGKALLSIVEDKENRGKVLQAGGARVLQNLIKESRESCEPPNRELTRNVIDVEPIQALAKLSITSSPVQVFGPNVGAMIDAIPPFSHMVTHPSSNLLQRFEGTMALTNIASYSTDLATRIAKADGLINKVELLLLEDHVLVQRASMELICNLIAGSDEIFERYGGGDTLGSAMSKLQVVLALSDVDDLPTRLAASGALATLTTSPGACRALLALQLDRHRFLPMLAQLISPSESTDSSGQAQHASGLLHRGVVCILNFLVALYSDARKSIFKEAKDAGLIESLADVTENPSVKTNEPIQRTAAQALKILMDSGK